MRVQAIDLRLRGQPPLHSLLQKHSKLSQLERPPFAQGRNGKSSVLQPRPTYLPITIKTPIHQAKTQPANPLKIPNPPPTANKLLQGLLGSLILITFHPCFHIKLITMRPGKTTHIFQLEEHSVRFTGNFDTGNLRNVLQVAPFEVSIDLSSLRFSLPLILTKFQHPPRLSFISLFKASRKGRHSSWSSGTSLSSTASEYRFCDIGRRKKIQASDLSRRQQLQTLKFGLGINL